MKDKFLSILFTLTLIFFLVFGIVLPDKEDSISERRRLQGFPELEVNNILDGTFFKDLNDYLVEQFPLRDTFRKIKGVVATKIFGKKENNNVFEEDGKIYELNASLNEKSIKHLTTLINKIKEENLEKQNLYFSIIPDKNYYLKNKSIPRLDYKKLENLLKEDLTDMTYIDIFDDLDLSSYYDTDIHWRQESLEKVVEKLANLMNFETYKFPETKKTYKKFYGALYGRLASNIKPDVLTYLTNEDIENAKVYNFEKNKYENVYEEKNLKNMDSYDIFLSGATPILTIENENQTNNKELIIFRDSYSSSITPLLISSYSKITLVDLRYISSTLLEQVEVLDFNNADDILFMYSVPVINNSFTLK